MSDLLTSVDEICERHNIPAKTFPAFVKLGLPVRIINGRYYASAKKVEEWLQYFLNPHESGGPVEISVSTDCPPPTFTSPVKGF